MKTKDPVIQGLIEHEINSGFEKIGLMNSKVWSEDPKDLFLLYLDTNLFQRCLMELILY